MRKVWQNAGLLWPIFCPHWPYKGKRWLEKTVFLASLRSSWNQNNICIPEFQQYINTLLHKYQKLIINHTSLLFEPRRDMADTQRINKKYFFEKKNQLKHNWKQEILLAVRFLKWTNMWSDACLCVSYIYLINTLYTLQIVHFKNYLFHI